MMKAGRVDVTYGMKVLDALKNDNDYDTKMMIINTIKILQK